MSWLGRLRSSCITHPLYHFVNVGDASHRRIVLQSESHAPQLTWTSKQNQIKQHFQPTCFAIYTKERQISCFHMDFVNWNGPWWSFSKKRFLRAFGPSLAVCWGWAEATPCCIRQHTGAKQRWWSCCSRPMHRWMRKTIMAGGLSSDATCSGPFWRVTVCLQVVIHRSFHQKSHLLRQPPSVHIFRV